MRTASDPLATARLLAMLCIVAVAACASAPRNEPQTADASVMVNNPLEVPVRIYQLYQLRAVFDATLSSASCIPLGDVPARDSAVFMIRAGADGPIGVVFQGDSLNGITADVSRGMQARSGEKLHFTVNRVLRINMPWTTSRTTARTLGPIPSQTGDGPGSRALERC